jgi:hypothetical protein
MSVALIPALRRAPLGVLLISAMLVIGGVGSLVAGGYLLLREGSLSTWAGATSIVIGPAILYFAYELVRLARWTWLALAVLLVLLFLSSIVRAIVSPGVPTAALLEVVLEIVAAAYISRRTIRTTYGWTRHPAT